MQLIGGTASTTVPLGDVDYVVAAADLVATGAHSRLLDAANVAGAG